MQPNRSSHCSSGHGYRPTGHRFFSSGCINPCCLNCSSGHPPTPNSFYLGGGNNRRGCGFLFSLGLFTDFTGSDYGALLYRLKLTPLKAVTAGKQGKGEGSSSEEPSGNLLVPWLCSSRSITWLFPYTTGAVPAALHRLRGRKESIGKPGP